MPLYALGDKAPQLPEDGSAWVAPSAELIGDVRLGRDASVWFGAVIRADNTPIVVGDRSNIQEAVMLHSDPGSPLTIGQGCTVGHHATLHGCAIGDNSLIGIGAVVLNNARIGKNCIVGAGALVTEGKDFPDGSLIIGAPAKAVRSLEPAAVERLERSAETYVLKARQFAGELRRIDP